MRQHCRYHNKNEWTQTIRIMKLTLSILFLFCVAAFGKTYSQQVTISAKNESLVNVIKQMRQQSDYAFVFRADQLKKSVPVNVLLRSVSMEEALREIFKNQPLEYEISEKTIYIKEKPVAKSTTTTQLSQQEQEKQDPIRGRVTDEQGEPLAGATIRIKDTNVVFITDHEGNFGIPYTYRDATLQVEYIGYKRIEITVQQASNIILLADQSEIDNINVVVNTGYQSLPRERSTGSFAVVDSALFHRRTSTNILDRLDGVTSGLIFNGLATNVIRTNPIGGSLGITIRGESTIQSSADPLIVLDNFPYEGNISNLNPNDIESVTILKDASAASIWGARAANGVIVITTKQGNLNEPLKIDFNSNVNIVAKPNIFGNRAYMSSPDFIDIERYLFNEGFFDADINNTATMTALSPVVEALANHRAGNLPDSDLQTLLTYLGTQDVRTDYDRFVHRQDVKQQYHLTLSGLDMQIKITV